jgi:hypothetical protein
LKAAKLSSAPRNETVIMGFKTMGIIFGLTKEWLLEGLLPTLGDKPLGNFSEIVPLAIHTLIYVVMHWHRKALSLLHF